MSDTNNTPALLRLEEDDVKGRLERLPDWALAGDVLQRTFAFADFLAAMAFVESIAAVAEAQGHHPDILIRYSKVTLALSTHEAGGLTNKDFTLAASIDELC